MNRRTIATTVREVMNAACVIVMITVTSTGSNVALDSAILPAIHDLRDVDIRCYITPVKTQA